MIAPPHPSSSAVARRPAAVCEERRRGASGVQFKLRPCGVPPSDRGAGQVAAAVGGGNTARPSRTLFNQSHPQPFLAMKTKSKHKAFLHLLE